MNIYTDGYIVELAYTGGEKKHTHAVLMSKWSDERTLMLYEILYGTWEEINILITEEKEN